MKEDAQQKYLEFQLISRQLNVLNQQVQLISNKINELSILIQSLDEISALKKDQEILMPIGPGILINANVNNNKEVLMNIGSEIVVEKSIADSKSIINSQIVELEHALSEAEREIISMNSELDSIRKDLTDSNE